MIQFTTSNIYPSVSGANHNQWLNEIGEEIAVILITCIMSNIAVSHKMILLKKPQKQISSKFLSCKQILKDF